MRTFLDNKNLPVKAKENTPALMKPSLSLGLLGISALGIVLTSFDLLFLITGVVGILLFIAGNLVNKSLATTQESLAHPDPFTLSMKETGQALVQTKYMNNVSALGERAHTQLQTLSERWKFLTATLAKKFSPGEITYDRYLKAIEETTALVLDNLKLLSVNLRSMEMMKTTEENFVKGKSDSEELLRLNDEALNELANLSQNLNVLNAGGSTTDNFEASLAEIRKLAERSKKYSS